jgi:deoxyribodipyrimidine photo-lyase
MHLPTKTAAHNALEAFLPKSGRSYAVGRNYDNGPAHKSTASKLSPWIRIRLLPEWEVLTAVLKQDTAEEASKFIDEVCWRTYWKGWLQMRPSVWHNYLEDKSQLLKTYNDHPGYQRAIQGRTGIECFDAWAKELVATNYLHNHARMWTASIWIHTLQLPWQLGADWFLRHLLDGDPASNTLSWRWVAGLHTRGKTYLARPDNIRKYTNQRFQVEENLAVEPVEMDEATPHGPSDLPPSERVPPGLSLGLLATEEDLSAVDWLAALHPITAVARYFPTDSYEALKICPEVIHFRHRALSDVGGDGIFENCSQLVEWAIQKQLDGVVTAEPTTGHWPEILKSLKSQLAEAKIELFTVRHWWDERLFPYATKGFFHFKHAIPDALEKLSVQSQSN